MLFPHHPLYMYLFAILSTETEHGILCGLADLAVVLGRVPVCLSGGHSSLTLCRGMLLRI